MVMTLRLHHGPEHEEKANASAFHETLPQSPVCIQHIRHPEDFVSLYDSAGADSDAVPPKQPAGPFIPASFPSSRPVTHGEGILQPAVDASGTLPTQINAFSTRDRHSSKTHPCRSLI